MIQKTTNPPGVSSRLAAHPLYAASTALWRQLRGALPPEGGVAGFASAVAGAGATTVTANVATCAAQDAFGPILVIDTHTQASPLAHRFGAPSYPGLADVLGGRATLDDCLRRTHVENVSLLSAGTVAQASTVEAAAFTALVNQLQLRFAYILCDLAAASEPHPSHALAGRLDGVLLVIEAGKAQIEAVKRARDRLVQAEARLLGVVLNKRVHQVPTWLEM